MTLNAPEEHKPTVFVQDAANEQPNKIPAKRLRRVVLIALAVLIVGGGAAFFASKRGLSEALLSQVLDAWIADQEATAKADGTEVDITYDAIALSGTFGSQSVVLSYPTLRIAAKGLTLEQSGDQITKFTTPRLILYPEDVQLENVRIEVPDVIEVTNGQHENPTFKISANTPLMLATAREKEDGKNFVSVKHYVPNAWKVQYLYEQEAVGEEDQTPSLVPQYKTYTITLDEGGKYHSRMMETQDLGEGMLNMSGITLNDEAGSAVLTIASIKSNWSGVVNDTGAMVQSFTLDIDNADAGDALPELEGYSPANVRIHAGIRAQGADQEQTMALTLDDVQANLAGSAVRITGGFEVGGAEILPLGKAAIDITNLSGLLETLQRDGFISKKSSAMVQDVAKAILDEPYNLSETVSFTVSRATDGGFMVGKVPFEALLGTVLRSAMEGVTIRAPETSAAPATEKTAPEANTDTPKGQ